MSLCSGTGMKGKSSKLMLKKYADMHLMIA